jgi:hypothetical protein
MKTSLVVFGALLTGALAACTVKTSKNDPSATTAPASSGAGGTTVTGPASSTMMASSSTGMMSCYDETIAYIAPGMATKTNLKKCTAQQIDDFQKSCLGMTATQMACDTYKAANADCFNCILPVDKNGNADGSTPPLLTYPSPDGMGGFAVVNQLACEAAAKGKPQCGPSVAQVPYCTTTACAACKTAEKTACQKEALAGVCAQIMVTTECKPFLDATTFDPKCDGADFLTLYKNVALYMCGP